MTQFWRLFTSDYVQDFVDSKPIPTKDEIVKTYATQFNKVLKIHKQKVSNFFQKLPTFEQFIEIVKEPAILHRENAMVNSRTKVKTLLTPPVYLDQDIDMAFA